MNGPWITGTLDYSVDDDLTSAIDLLDAYEAVEIDIPTIEAATAQIHGATNGINDTYDPIGASAPVASSVGGFRVTVPLGGKYQYIKIALSVGQTADRTFYVRGVKYAAGGLQAILDRITNIIDDAADAVRVAGVQESVTVTKLMIADAKGAADVISESASAGTAWIFTFSGVGSIDKVVLAHDAAITPRLVLLLFNALPTGVLNDNVANTSPLTADVPKFLGAINLPAMTYIGSGDAYAVGTPNTPASNLPISFDAPVVYGILVTLDAVTLVAENLSITMSAILEAE